MIDLFYQHRVDPDVPIEDVAGAVKDLIARRQGQAFRPVGSERADDPPRPRGAAGHRAAERIFAVVARSPKRRCCRRSRSSASASCRSARSGKGFLTGKIDASDQIRPLRLSQHACRASRPRRVKANQALVDLLGDVAKRKGATPAQIALAWLLRRSRGSCRFPAPPSSTAWKRISGRPPSRADIGRSRPRSKRGREDQARGRTAIPKRR